MKSWIPVIFLVAVGCSHGFDRKAMREQLWQDNPIFTDKNVRRIEGLRPQIQLPMKLAVAPGHWNAAEKKVILSWGDELKKAGVVSDFVVIPRLLVRASGGGSSYLSVLRAAAAPLHNSLWYT